MLSEFFSTDYFLSNALQFLYCCRKVVTLKNSFGINNFLKFLKINHCENFFADTILKFEVFVIWIEVDFDGPVNVYFCQ